MSSAASAPAEAKNRNETVIVFALSLAAMVVSMMQTLPVPILGLIRNDLGTSTANVSWVTTATLLSAAVFTPCSAASATSTARSPPWWPSSASWSRVPSWRRWRPRCRC